MRHNLATQERRTISTGFFGVKPQWGKNGWILLSVWDSLGFNVYKIRDDGSDLTPLTTSGNCYNPIWDIDSKRISYAFNNVNPTRFILMDEDGEFIDTMPCGVGSS